jgi:hypothetical protein
MPNRTCIQRTTFIDHPTGEKTFGYRIYDDYYLVYADTHEESIFQLSELETINLVFEEQSDKTSGPLFDDLFENEKGISVDGVWLDYEQIKDIIAV